MNTVLLLALAATAIDLVGSVNYIRAVVRGETKPHVFSWFVWAILMFIGTAVSLSEGAWAAAISLTVGATINTTVCLLGLRAGAQHYIRRSDWVALFAALSAIPVWLLTNEALWAALIITAINASGCYPTFRKAWALPQDENLKSFTLYSVASLLRLLSVSPFTLTTALYPAIITGANIALSLMIYIRRRSMRQSLPAQGVPHAL